MLANSREAAARRLSAAKTLDDLVLVSANYLAHHDESGHVCQRLVAHLVEVGRTELEQRLRRLRVEAPSRWEAFDGPLIQELVGHATEAMSRAWHARAADTTIASPAPGANEATGAARRRSTIN
jgi:hypothetical protein